ncbi:MAG: type VI secretion system baseplate subunit TssK [candidate division Zixibacteria bacterium]|nr:type VI secretion system baseplate subunit TssK [candidate division Zixibacteria bacterium]
MPQYHKILWSEGLFLTQHHFQQWDRYHEKNVTFQLRSLAPFAWGVWKLTIDREAVANKLLTLRELEGIFPDGSAVRIPAVDAPPETRSMEGSFGPGADVLSVYLGFPVLRPGAAGVKMEANSKETRYEREFVSLPDEVTGEGEREVAYAKKGLKILFSGDNLEGFDYIKIAEVERAATGVLQLRESYIPPALSLLASDYLVNLARGHLELLAAKSNALTEKVRQRTPQMAEFSTTDFPNFLLLQTVNAFIPTLAHFYNHPEIHPVQFYLELVRLTGALATFNVGAQPRALPPYRHEELGELFGELDKKIRQYLEVVVSERYTVIPLVRKDESMYEGAIADGGLLESAQFYLGVTAEIPESRLIAEFPLQAKIISPDKIARLVGGNLPGVALNFIPLPPAVIPRKAGLVYFRLDARGDRWDFIREAKAVSIYAPPRQFPGFAVELIAVGK